MAKTNDSAGDILLSIIKNVTPEDLDELNKSIAEKEQELASLQAVRQVFMTTLGIEVETKKPRGRRPATVEESTTDEAIPTTSPSPVNGSQTGQRRQQCVRYIFKNGPQTGKKLSELFNFPLGSVPMVSDHEWFTSTPNGYDLTARGREAAQQLGASR